MMKKARIRTRQDSWHPVLLTFSFAAIGLSVWGYWRLAQDALYPAPAAVHGSKPEASSALRRARAEFRRAHLDPLAHIRLAEALHREGRLVDSFLALEGARGFFGEGRFAFAHDEVILEGDPQAAAPAPTGPAWATQQALDFERQARSLAGRADFFAALKSVEAGLAVSPQEPSLTALKALLLSRFLERGAEALSLYRSLALGDPAAPAGRLAVEFLGRRAHLAAIQRGPEGARSGDPSGTQAIETLEELARTHPDDPRVFQTLGMLRWTEGKLDAVRELVKTALARNPKHAGALSLAGALALNDKDADGAIRYLEKALVEEPADLYSALKLAELRHRYRADRRAALPLWIAVHRLDPWRESQGRPVADIIHEAIAEFSSEAIAGAAADRVATMLDDDDAGIRAEACVAAGKSREPRFASLLATLLDDDVGLVRKTADEALFAIAQSSPSSELHDSIFGLLDSEKALVRSRALNLAADLYRDEAKPRALAALHDANPAIRVVARMTVEHYYPGDPAAALAVRKSAAEEGSELAWALLSSRGNPRPGAAPPEGAPDTGPEAEPTPTPTITASPKKPKPLAVLAGESRRRGEALLKTAKLVEAAAAFERAERLSGGDPDTFLGLARAYSRLRDASRSSIALRRCLAAAKGLGPKPLERYRRAIKHDAQLTFVQSQPGFAILLAPYENY